jgi:hypothetical protein
LSDLRVLTSVGDSTLAHIIKGMLEAEDIPVMLRGAGDASLWISGGRNGAFAIDVLVLARDLGRAAALLAEADLGDTGE